MLCFCGTKDLKKVNLPKPGYQAVQIAGVYHSIDDCFLPIYCEHCEVIHNIHLVRVDAHPTAQTQEA